MKFIYANMGDENGRPTLFAVIANSGGIDLAPFIGRMALGWMGEKWILKSLYVTAMYIEMYFVV